jgi:hypothetical protein
MGVSRSETIFDRARAGAEKASLTPSNNPFKAVLLLLLLLLLVAACCWLLG